MRDAKGGTSRTVPLTRRAHEVLHTWWDARPPSTDGTLFISLESRLPARTPSPPPPSRASSPSTPSVPGCPDGLRAPHVMRHTFCTLLAEHDVPIDVIRDLAGHASIRTTQKYIHVTDQRRGQAIARLGRRKHPLDHALE